LLSSTNFLCDVSGTDTYRGLDNAGKTTIVKKIMGEDVNTVSPTLGFIIKTIDYQGYVGAFPCCLRFNTDIQTDISSTYVGALCH
jgi:GTPase SAR1 family protein